MIFYDNSYRLKRDEVEFAGTVLVSREGRQLDYLDERLLSDSRAGAAVFSFFFQVFYFYSSKFFNSCSSHF